ncbi:hypothetical protein [Parvicella tangerina]|uniref:Uncharacterized protein n=1 Tax=Parvicella tangerina TaxID=2829795 RepID=A0A916JQU2_9FLAO|nr:hypothetical protein [Parvicella tangerina]CAG5086913.1 hypothetical protein CRYO30217_03328 [Parvicella tangerina]
MKKVVIILIVLLTLVSTYFAFQFLKSEAELAKDPIESVPMDAAVIIESNNLSKSWFRISETNLVYSSLLSIDEVKYFDKTLKKVDSLLSLDPNTSTLLGQKPAVISLHSGDGSIQLFVSTSCTEKSFETLKNQLSKNYQLTSLSNQLYELKLDQEDYFLSYDAPFVLFSTDANLIKSSIQSRIEHKSLLDDSTFVKLRNSTSSNLGLSLYMNGKRTGSMLTPYLNKGVLESWSNGNVLPSWVALDVNEKSNTIIINGLSSNDANNKWFTNIKTQQAQNSKSLVLLPTDLLSLKRSSISDATLFLDNTENYLLDDIAVSCGCEPKTTFSNWITGEVISIQFGNEENKDNAYFIGCEGTPNMVGVLSAFGVADTLFKTVYDADLYAIEDKNFLSLLGLEDTTSQPLYFSRMHDYAVVSTYKGISKLAYQYKASQSSIPNNRFINFAKQLMANYSSVDVYYAWNSLLDNASRYFKEEYQSQIFAIKQKISDLNGLIWQGSYTSDGFIYHSVAINTNQANEQEGVVQKLWSFNLQHNASTPPQVMKNHQTGTNEVVVQDENNNIILLSATGKHKWSKPINEKIIGEIKQIDVYQNGKFQMLFNTATKIHLLDINGNEVTGFPINLPAQATNEVAVFDYENDGNYRFLINTMDKKLLNYSKDGKQVQGWVVNTTDQIVLNKVEHFILSGLDYIAVHDISGKVYLFNRKGEPRTNTTLSSLIQTSEKENVYLQVGTSLGTTKFIFKDSLGQIAELPLDGKLDAFVLDSTMHQYKHQVVDLENDKLPDFLISFGNKLSVYGPDKKMFFSEIFDFDIHNNFKTVGYPNKYTLISNEKSQVVHLYTYQFKPVPDFPQPGSIKSCMGDLNKDGKMEFITIVNGKEVVCYSIDLLFGI